MLMPIRSEMPPCCWRHADGFRLLARFSLLFSFFAIRHEHTSPALLLILLRCFRFSDAGTRHTLLRHAASRPAIYATRCLLAAARFSIDVDAAYFDVIDFAFFAFFRYAAHAVNIYYSPYSHIRSIIATYAIARKESLR